MRLSSLLGLLLLVSTPALAGDEAFLSYGVGIFNSADQYLGQNKIISVGYRQQVIGGFYLQSKLGFWGEGSGHADRKASFYASYGIGVKVNLAPIEIRTGWSLAFITHPDSQLGARFPQFNGDIYAGVRDKYGMGIGVRIYEHLSCASFCSPNQGRDFGSIEVSQEF
jgi:hypothetical protein